MLSDLQCPVCRHALANAVDCADCGRKFLRCAGLPVLIDFDNSIFRPEEYPADRRLLSSPKGSRFGVLLAQLTYPSSRSAAANVTRLVRGLVPGSKVLIIGGGTIGVGLERLTEANLQIVATDVYPSENIALICDGHSLPFSDGSFDAVIIQAVLEHVLDPTQVVAEIHRVLKPRGWVYAVTPFMQQVHMEAYDFTRFTHSGHRWLFRHFEEETSGAELGPATSLIWSISYFLKSLGLSAKTAALATAAFAWLRLFERQGKKRKVLDAASGFYFLGRASDTPLKPSDMPAYYERYR